MKRMTGKAGSLIKMLLAAAILVLMMGMTVSAGEKYVESMVKDSNGVYTYLGQWEKSNPTVYHKIKVPATGVLLVTGCAMDEDFSSTYDLKIQLYNSKFKHIDSKYGQTVNTFTESKQFAVYGVKKGTYYLKTTGEEYYVISAGYSKMANNGGTSKKKAYRIERNKLTYGLMPAGESSGATDWYKFKVTKKRILQIDLDVLGSGMFDFWLYGPSYKKGCHIDTLENEEHSYYTVNLATGAKLKVKPGTYYIKVKRYKYSKQASGAYSIKWKMR